MPLPRLQRVGLSYARFVYEIGCAEDVALKDVRRSKVSVIIRCHLAPATAGTADDRAVGPNGDPF
jgi:hypothetical protein